LVSQSTMGRDKENTLISQGYMTFLEQNTNSRQTLVSASGPMTAMPFPMKNWKSPVASMSRPTLSGSLEIFVTASTIAAIITGSDNNLGCPTQYLMKLLMKSAEKQGIVLEVIDPMLVELLPEKLIKRFFQDKAIEGVVILTGYFTGQEPLVQRMKALKLPVVLPHGEMGDNLRTGFASVVADERRAFAQTLEFVQHKNFVITNIYFFKLYPL